MTEPMGVLYRLKNAAGPDPWDWIPLSSKELATFDMTVFLEGIARLNCLAPKGIYKVEGFLVERKLARIIVADQKKYMSTLEDLYNKLFLAQSNNKDVKKLSKISKR